MIGWTFFKFSVFWPDSTHQPTHQAIHPLSGWWSLHRFKIFKQNWNISISSSAIEFWLIPGSPWGWGYGYMGVVVVRRCPPHTCTWTYMHTCTHVYDIIGNSQGFPQCGLPFAIEIIMLNVYMCMCAHVCVCMHVCAHVWGYPQPPPTPIHPPPHPRAAGSPKHQNSISLELIKIIRFCLNTLFESLNIPELI